MRWREWGSAGRALWQLGSVARELPDYLREPLDRARATAALRQRLAQRDARFVGALSRQLAARPSGPVASLLASAGWSMARIDAAVRRDGLQIALCRLRDDGVFFTHAELIGAEPLRRRGLELRLQPSDFDNASLAAARLGGSTSGSRSNGIRVFYSWDFLAEEAANELLLFCAHALDEAPMAYWMPGVPALSGIHNLLFDLKSRRAPRRWFAQVDAIAAGPARPTRAASAALLRAAFAYVVWRCRDSVAWTAAPELTPLADAHRVAAWLGDAVRDRGCAVLKCYASAAVRVAAAARNRGLDLSGCVVFTGGEPLTHTRRRFIEASGARAFPRYVTTELGLMAGACPRENSTDAMHVYLDRIAAISAGDGSSLLFTSVSPHSGKILLNADLGDVGVLERRACTCALGELGLDLFVSEVRSHVKLAGEGVKLAVSEVNDLIAPLIEAAGGGPDDYQFWEEADETGRSHLVVAVAPEVTRFEERTFIAALIGELKRQPLRGNLAGQLWEQGETIRVVRQQSVTSRGHKHLVYRA